MGTSSDAYLFYGVPLGATEDNEDGDWNDIIIDAMGGPPSVDARDEGLTYAEWKSTDACVAWCKRQSERNDFFEALGVEVLVHCCDEYPMLALCIPEARLGAARGEETLVDVVALAAGPVDEWQARLQPVCAALGIDDPEFGWYLVSKLGG